VARVLLGWELGANRGHLVRLAAIAEGLIAKGHEVAIAAQRLSRTVPLPPQARLWQAPVWPRLLANVGGLGGPAPNTMGDILVRLGLDEPETLPVLIGAWEQILGAFKPDAVMADFAPALLSATRGRLPTMLVGLSFDAVPHELPQFPCLTGQPAIYLEEETLARVNAGLDSSGRPPLQGLPQIFQADRVLAGTFAEFDAYAGWRRDPVFAPSVAHPVGEAGVGEEIFLYADQVLLRTTALWDGVARSVLPVRIYAQGATPAQQAELERLGFLVERSPIPFARIAERSRLAISYGGSGFVSSAAAAGVPSVVVHYDLEKRLIGEAVTRLQLGGNVAAGAIQPEAFATSLRQIYQNDSFQRRARELAPGFRDRLYPTQEEEAVRLLAGLI
jgi:rhamnosyltransferase subunit B